MEPQSHLQISSEIDSHIPHRIQLHLNGKLNSSAVKWFRSEIDRLLMTGYKEIDLDLSALQYIDSFGLAELIPVYQVVKEKEGDLKIVNPRRLIRHILTTAHLDDVIEIGPALEE